MEVLNVGMNKIKMECTYDELAKIVYALDRPWEIDDEVLREIVYKMHNPKVVVNE
ncbi:hypothetical protein [Virgibacillus sp. SK37]|uniref:hypothetical protein n=1 Tax=Virgibacillus sp. SK37 TaxID=403957 RepID=UPI001444170D|nr:hypothetical protein [Virgibacillus sp. SK37]